MGFNSGFKGLNRYSIIAEILEMTACETVSAIKFRKPEAVLNIKSQQVMTSYIKDQF